MLEKLNLQLFADELLGTWVFKSTLVSTPNYKVGYSITFNLFGGKIGEYNKIYHDIDHNAMVYEKSVSGEDFAYSFNISEFADTKYQIIEITDVSSLTNRDEFTNWLKANATKQEPKTLKEVFTDIANAIREKTGKSTKIIPLNMANEIKSIVVQKDELLGTWVFKDKLTMSQAHLYYNIDFTSNNEKNYYIETTDNTFDEDYVMRYDGIDVYNTSSYNENPRWTNNAYKTIEITDVSGLGKFGQGHTSESREKFTTWLKANATKQ